MIAYQKNPSNSSDNLKSSKLYEMFITKYLMNKLFDKRLMFKVI